VESHEGRLTGTIERMEETSESKILEKGRNKQSKKCSQKLTK
jgi:hypothetical protein